MDEGELDTEAHSAGAIPQVRVGTRDRAAFILRCALFVCLALVLCPLRYELPVPLNLDNTWMFALNYAAAHHLVMGRDFIWTFGPLAYLLVPFNIGNNLGAGLIFQFALWFLLVIIVWDVFFRGSFPLRNLVFFSVLLCLSALNFHQERYPGAPLLYAGLILLGHFRSRGGSVRYVAALALLGLTPLMQFYQAVMAMGIVTGFIADLAARGLRKQKKQIALAVAVPAFVAIAGCLMALGSIGATVAYFKWSLELTRGYTAAMSLPRGQGQFVAALGIIAVLIIALLLAGRHNREAARFFALILVVPMILSLKHGFVRQDGTHVLQFACFAALALAVTSLGMQLHERLTQTGVAVVLVLFAICWSKSVPGGLGPSVRASLSCFQSSTVTWDALHFKRFRQSVDVQALYNFRAGSRIEPEIKSIIGHERVAFLSEDYSNALVDGVNLALLPVLQLSTAYTPSLDQWNATWIDGKAPRFLIFDALTVDARQPWAQTPRTWAEVYRWYSTRWLSADHLLLERRDKPRFARFEPVARVPMRFGRELAIPLSPDPVFWNMQCRETRRGKLHELLLRDPAVVMGVKENNGSIWWGRVIVPVLGAPTLGNHLPTSLAEFAQVLREDERPSFSVTHLQFVSLGDSPYAPDCEVQFLRPEH